MGEFLPVVFSGVEDDWLLGVVGVRIHHEKPWLPRRNSRASEHESGGIGDGLPSLADGGETEKGRSGQP